MGSGRLKRPAFAVGLTGGIGSGKSAAADIFAGLGVPVLDADRVVHELTGPGGAAVEAVAALFGPEVRGPGGTLRRDRMRAAVFRDAGLRERLQALLHPLVYREIRSRLDKVQGPYCIVAIPLLVEAGGRELVDRVLVIDAPEELQVERTRQRDGISAADVRRIMDTQAARAARLAAADDVIVNDGSLDDLRHRVEALHRRYLERAGVPVAGAS